MNMVIFRKGMVFAVIVLFLGASVVSGINSNVELVDVIDEIGNLNRGTETFYPTDDTTLRMKVPDNNYGSREYLSVRNRYGHPSQPEYWEHDVLIRFDLLAIPTGTSITSAILNIYYYAYDENNPAGRDLTLYRVTSDWDEDTVTWNTRPSIASAVTSYDVVPNSPGSWMEWDVTSDVNDFVDENKVNYGWQIMDEQYWGGYDVPDSKFRSKEYGSIIPYLEIEYENTPPNNPSTPSGPTSLMEGDSGTYSTSATDPDGDDVKYGWDWDGDNSIDEWTGFHTSGTSIQTSHKWNTPGTFYVKVKAKDINDGQSSFSSALTVVVMANEPPDIPTTPTGPTILSLDTPGTFSTSSSDPEGENIKYGWDWDGDDEVDEWTGFYSSGLTVITDHSWSQPGTYIIRVKAQDSNGGQSSFSSSLTVNVVENEPPNTPELTGPDSGKTGTSYTYTAMSTDPDGDALYYFFDWGDGNDTGWVGTYDSGVDCSESHVWDTEKPSTYVSPAATTTWTMVISPQTSLFPFISTQKNPSFYLPFYTTIQNHFLWVKNSHLNKKIKSEKKF